MTTNEFSNEFDVMVQEYFTARQFSTPVLGFNEYEKSVFLTQVQDDLVKDLYSGESKFGESFEETERLRRYLSNLVCSKVYKLSDAQQVGNDKKLFLPSPFSSFYFKAPSDLMYIVWEQCYSKATDNCGVKAIDVYPVTHDTLSKNLRNPFRQPKENSRCFRLDLENGLLEIITKNELKTDESYRIRYVRRPKPIVLENIELEDLNIRGVGTISECELSEDLHKLILENAVNRALASRLVALQNSDNRNRISNAQ